MYPTEAKARDKHTVPFASTLVADLNLEKVGEETTCGPWVHLSSRLNGVRSRESADHQSAVVIRSRRDLWDAGEQQIHLGELIRGAHERFRMLDIADLHLGSNARHLDMSNDEGLSEMKEGNYCLEITPLD